MRDMSATKATSKPQSPALAGATVLVTRPAGTARALVARIRARGGTALLLPGLSVRATRDASVAPHLRAMSFDDWIFTSPAAVRACFALAPSLRFPRHARAFAVGAGTRRALARRGVAACAPESGADSEALLALPQLGDVRGRRIALVGAAGGRNLIAPTLRERGAVVEAVHVYERRAARLTRRHFDALAAAPQPWITLLSSAEALDNLCACLPPDLAARWRRQPLVVASERLAALARARGFADIGVARSALGDDLLDAAARRLARHRL